MLNLFVLLIIILVAVLWYHEAIFVRNTSLGSIKGFNFIYKEHRSSYQKCDKIYNKLDKLLEKNAKNIKTYVNTGKATEIIF